MTDVELAELAQRELTERRDRLAGPMLVASAVALSASIGLPLLARALLPVVPESERGLLTTIGTLLLLLVWLRVLYVHHRRRHISAPFFTALRRHRDEVKWMGWTTETVLVGLVPMRRRRLALRLTSGSEIVCACSLDPETVTRLERLVASSDLSTS